MNGHGGICGSISVGKPRQGISVGVLPPRAVMYLHVVLAQFLEPTGQLILRGLKVEEPN
jgi:hypothetical protein